MSSDDRNSSFSGEDKCTGPLKSICRFADANEDSLGGVAVQNKTELSPSFFNAMSTSPFAPVGDAARADEPTEEPAVTDMPIAPTWGESVWSRTQDDHEVAVRSDLEPTSESTELDWGLREDDVAVKNDRDDGHDGHDAMLAPAPFAASPFEASPFAVSPFATAPSPFATAPSPFAPTSESAESPESLDSAFDSPSNPGHSPFGAADSSPASPFSGGVKMNSTDAVATAGPTWSTSNPVPEPFAPASSTVWGDLPQPPAPPPSFATPPLPHPVESFRPLADEVASEFESRPFHELAAAHLRSPAESVVFPAAEAFAPVFERVPESVGLDRETPHDDGAVDLDIESAPAKRRFSLGRKGPAAIGEVAGQSTAFTDLAAEPPTPVAKARRFSRSSSPEADVTDDTVSVAAPTDAKPSKPGKRAKAAKPDKSEKPEKTDKPAKPAKASKGSFFAKQTDDELLLAKSNTAGAPVALRVAAVVSLAAGIGLFGYTVVRGTSKPKVVAPVTTVAPPTAGAETPPSSVPAAPIVADTTPSAVAAPTVAVDPVDPLTPVPTLAPGADGDPTATPTVPPAGDDLSFSSGSDFTA